MKTRVAMLFGGKSVEHEVSVISGIQAVMSMDTDKYEVIPVYMTKRNEMYIGEEIGKIGSGVWRTLATGISSTVWGAGAAAPSPQHPSKFKRPAPAAKTG